MNTVQQNPKEGLNALFPYLIDPLAAICISYLVHPYYSVVNEINTLPEAADLYFEKCLIANFGLTVKIPDSLKIPLFNGLFSSLRNKNVKNHEQRVRLMQRIIKEVKLYDNEKVIGTYQDADLTLHHDYILRMPIFYFKYPRVLHFEDGL